MFRRAGKDGGGGQRREVPQSHDEVFVTVEMGQNKCPHFSLFLFYYYNYFCSDECSAINDHHIRVAALAYHCVMYCINR